ncbi:MAG: hypothetical protein ACXAB8_14495 [Promethearchaeota archaeon]
MSLSRFNYCPYCGNKISGLNVSKLNYCSFCGISLKKTKKSTNAKTQCTICHKHVIPTEHKTIECSFCSSPYHYTCIESWLSKYNSCPLCLNVFLNPIKIVNNTRKKN